MEDDPAENVAGHGNPVAGPMWSALCLTLCRTLMLQLRKLATIRRQYPGAIGVPVNYQTGTAHCFHEDTPGAVKALRKNSSRASESGAR